MRQFDLVESLMDVWCYSLYVMEDQPLPADYAVKNGVGQSDALKRYLHPWDLDILFKELVLNAGKKGNLSHLRTWDHLAVPSIKYDGLTMSLSSVTETNPQMLSSSFID